MIRSIGTLGVNSTQLGPEHFFEHKFYQGKVLRIFSGTASGKFTKKKKNFPTSRSIRWSNSNPLGHSKQIFAALSKQKDERMVLATLGFHQRALKRGSV